MINECVAVDGITIDGKRYTQRKHPPVPACPSQIPPDPGLNPGRHRREAGAEPSELWHAWNKFMKLWRAIVRINFHIVKLPEIQYLHIKRLRFSFSR
jgi:hypothetical protein